MVLTSLKHFSSYFNDTFKKRFGKTFYIKKLRPNLNTQADSIRAKLFV